VVVAGATALLLYVLRAHRAPEAPAPGPVTTATSP